MLYGVNCTKEVWDYLNPYFNDYDIDYVTYPHDITLKAKKVEDITEWVYKNYHDQSYDAIIGHSMGGIIALQLVAKYKMKVDKVIYLDTNLKPSKDFYKNLMTQENMDKYGQLILKMLNNERKFYTSELLESIQSDFDYTNLIDEISQNVFAIYGDRGIPEYQDRRKDLNLPQHILNRLNLEFISNSCHMMMVENPEQLSMIIKNILSS